MEYYFKKRSLDTYQNESIRDFLINFNFLIKELGGPKQDSKNIVIVYMDKSFIYQNH